MNEKVWNLSRIENPEIKMLGGVASGISYAFGVAPWIVRLAFLIGALFSLGVAVLVYMIMWLILPKITVSIEDFNARALGIKRSIPPVAAEFSHASPVSTDKVIVVNTDASAQIITPSAPQPFTNPSTFNPEDISDVQPKEDKKV